MIAENSNSSESPARRVGHKALKLIELARPSISNPVAGVGYEFRFDFVDSAE